MPAAARPLVPAALSGARPRAARKAAAHRAGPGRRQARQGRRPVSPGPGDPGAAARRSRRRRRRPRASRGRRTRRCCATRSSTATTAAIVINKPPGLAVQGGTKTERHVDGLLDGLRFDSDERPRLVHRLDKDTSGVLLIARTAAAAALLHPRVSRQDDAQDLLGGRRRRARNCAGPDRPGPRQRHRRAAASGCSADDEDGKNAVTYYRGDRPRRRPGELARAAAGDRAHPPAARPLRRDRHADPRRRQVWRRRRASRRAARPRTAAPARPRLEIPHPAGGTLAGHRAAAAAYAADCGNFSASPATPRDPFAELELDGMKRVYKTVATAGGRGRLGRDARRPAAAHPGKARAARAERSARRGDRRGVGRAAATRSVPRTMPLTRLAATAIDRTAPQRDADRRRDRQLRRHRPRLLPRRPSAGAGRAPAGGVAAADRLGRRALRRGARGHHRHHPEAAVAGGAARPLPRWSRRSTISA